MTLAIETENLSKLYTLGALRRRTVRALSDLSLKVERGELIGLLGPNGAGKSTAIKLLLNLIRPTAGSVRLFGLPPSDASARAKVGFLPENPAPYEYLTGREFVTLAGQLAGVSGGDVRRRAGEVIERVGMARAANLQIRKYSKGMIQRISLAQALVTEPELLVLDEPTSGLDVLGRQLVRDIVLEQRKRGTTVLFCSHIIPDVEALSDRVVVLIGGRLVKEGRVSELLADEKGLVEIIVEGLAIERLAAVDGLLKSKESLGDRLQLRCEEAATRDVLACVLAEQGRVTSLRRTRYSLEALFLDALKSSSNSVGSDIS